MTDVAPASTPGDPRAAEDPKDQSHPAGHEPGGHPRAQRSSGTGTAVTGEERIAAAFTGARAEDRAALMPYLMGGYPDLHAAREVADAYVAGGADLIELGVPFSDPLADGPVIHAAATEALRGGTTMAEVLRLCAGVADRIPVVPMIYANMALAGGPHDFAARLADAGAAGAIVPDLPHEEAGALSEQLAARGLALIPLIAPTTPAPRRRAICADARGFVYVVSVTGVTGERGRLPAELAELTAAVRAESPVPAAVGFGIATPDDAARVGAIADGVIIGTRLVREAGERGAHGCELLLREMRGALATGS